MRGAVTSFRLADGKQQLRVREQIGNLILPLVAQVLADPLLHHRLGRMTAGRFSTLRLDHHQRNTIHIAHHIGYAGMRALSGQHFQLFRDIPAVAIKFNPIHHLHRGLMPFTIRHEFSDSNTQHQLAIQLFIGWHQSFCKTQRRQLPHHLIDAASGKRIPLPLVLIAARLQYLDQPPLEQHFPRAATQRQGLRRGDEVPAEVA